VQQPFQVRGKEEEEFSEPDEELEPAGRGAEHLQVPH